MAKKEPPVRGRREEVLSAAARIFSKNGYRSSTIQDISRELGFTSAALYYYFDGKELILNELIMRPIRMLNAEAEAAASLPTESGLEKIRHLVHRHIELISKEHDLFSILLRERLELGHEATVELQKLESDYYRQVKELIDVCVADGEAVVRDSKFAALALVGMINWVLRWYNPEGPMTSTEIADAFFEIFLQGVEPRPAGA